MRFSAEFIRKRGDSGQLPFLKDRRKDQMMSLRGMVFLLFGTLTGCVTFMAENRAAMPTHRIPKSVMICVGFREDREYPLVLTGYAARQSIVWSTSILAIESPVMGSSFQKSKAVRSAVAAKVNMPITDNARQATKTGRNLWAGKKPINLA
jgi:hypothetical protein